MNPPLGRKTLMFDFCWVCKERFKNSVPPGPANREDHHIFPRNAGGTDGPLVSLCDRHHTTIHKIAERVHRKAPFADLLNGEKDEDTSKLIWLAGCIYKAEKSVEGDANKKLVNSISLTQTQIMMLDRLKTIYPKKGRSDIFGVALLHLYRSHFK